MNENFKIFITELVRYLRTYTVYGKSVIILKENKENLEILYNLLNEKYSTDKVVEIIANYIRKNKESEDSFNGFGFSDIPKTDTKLYSFYEEYIHNNLTLFTSFLLDYKKAIYTDYVYIIIVLMVEDVSNIKTKKLTSLKGFIETLEHYEHNIKDKQLKIWYRGQQDSSWGLIPSIYRHIDRNKIVIMDDNDLKTRYSSYGIADKYKKIFNKNLYNYEFFSYMQHSISYSPLLDFTDSFLIACSFSLSNKGQVESFFNKDSVIYAIKFKEENSKDIEITDFKVAIAKKPLEKMNIQDWIILVKEMIRLDDEPEIWFYYDESNDRMKYQKGKFVLFNNFILFGDRVNVKSTNSVQFFKLIIDKNIKPQIYDYIAKNYPEYTIKYLMDPYLWFTE